MRFRTPFLVILTHQTHLMISDFHSFLAFCLSTKGMMSMQNTITVIHTLIVLLVFLTHYSYSSTLIDKNEGFSNTTRLVITYNPLEKAMVLEKQITEDKNAILSVLDANHVTHQKLSDFRYVLFINSNHHPQDLITFLKQHSHSINTIQEDVFVQSSQIINDPYYQYQWQFFSNQYGIDIDPELLYESLDSITVAVLDTGYYFHQDVDSSLINQGYDFVSDPNLSQDGNGRDDDAIDTGFTPGISPCEKEINQSWHGTQVSSIISAETNNFIGMSGIAPNADILPVRVLGPCGGYLSDIADAIRWSAGLTVPGIPINEHPAKVINLSLGGYSVCPPFLQNAINEANDHGSLIITAAGNGNVDANTFTPANCNGVITIAASDQEGKRQAYSNFGSTIDLFAPGGNLQTHLGKGILVASLNTNTQSQNQEGYQFVQGTSFAAPHVSGVAALLLGKYPELTRKELKDALVLSSLPGNDQTCTDVCTDSVGVVNAKRAIQYIEDLKALNTVQNTHTLESTHSTISLNPGLLIANNDSPTLPFILYIDNHETLKGLQGLKGSQAYVSFTVSENISSLTLRLEGQGDADLYLNYQKIPTSNQFICRPFIQGSNEVCELENLQPGYYFILIEGFDKYHDVSLSLHYETASD